MNKTFFYKLPILFFAFFIFQFAKAQTTTKGRVVIFTDAKNSVVRLGDEKINELEKIIDFEPGNYLIKLWAPGHELVTDSVKITANQITLIRKELPLTNDYKEYLAHEKKIKAPLNISIAGSCILVLLDVGSYAACKSYKKKADDAYLAYTISSFGGSSTYQSYETYSDYYKKYDKYKKINKTLVYASAILIPVSLICSAEHYKDNTKPYQDKNILLSRLEPIVKYNFSSTSEIGLRLKF